MLRLVILAAHLKRPLLARMKIFNSTKLLPGLCRIVLVTGMILKASGECLRRESAEQLCASISQQRLATLKVERNVEVEARAITHGSHTLNWLESEHGKRGEQGWPLWISLHGGGEVPSVVNDEQWRKHATLYKPNCGIYVAPRAPTNTWFLWQEPHIIGSNLLSRFEPVRVEMSCKVWIHAWASWNSSPIRGNW